MKHFTYLIIITSLLTNSCSLGNKGTNSSLKAAEIPAHFCTLPILIAISSNVPEEQHRFIRKGLNFWNKKLGLMLFYDFGTTPYAPDQIKASGVVNVGYPKKSKPTTAYATTNLTYLPSDGCITRASIEIHVDLSILEEREAYFVMRHEFGHLLGLKDKEIRDDIMSSETPRFYDPSIEEVSDEQINFIDRFYGRNK